MAALAWRRWHRGGRHRSGGLPSGAGAGAPAIADPGYTPGDLGLPLPLRRRLDLLDRNRPQWQDTRAGDALTLRLLADGGDPGDQLRLLLVLIEFSHDCLHTARAQADFSSQAAEQARLTFMTGLADAALRLAGRLPREDT